MIGCTIRPSAAITYIVRLDRTTVALSDRSKRSKEGRETAGRIGRALRDDYHGHTTPQRHLRELNRSVKHICEHLIDRGEESTMEVYIDGRVSMM